MIDFPIVEVKLRSMEQTLTHAFSGQADDLKEMAESAIKSALRPENVRRIMQEKAQAMLTKKIDDAVRNWFVGADGSKLIVESVRKKLDAMAEYL